MGRKWLGILFLGTLLLSGCFSHTSSPAGPGAKATDLTVGKVQGEIKMGMPASEVAAILGSPNIVTTDEKRREVWIYDKVSTNRVDTRKSVGGTIIILSGRTSQAENTTTQKTLTVIIKYDENKLVRDFAYNYTQF